MTRRRPPLFLVAVLVAAAACGHRTGRSAAPPDPPQTAQDPPMDVTIGYSALRISLPVFVAQERGLFRAHGLHVTLRRYDTAQPLVEEVLDGRVDAGGYAAIPIVMVASARDGSRARLVTAILEDTEHPITALLARAGEGAPRGVADLAGKRVGILPTVAYQRWLDVVLRHAGVDPQTVHVVPVPPPQQVQQLDDGAVDALFTGDPMATAALAHGVGTELARAPVPTALGGHVVFGTFLVSTRLATERPEVASRIAAALDDAIAEIARDGAAGYSAMTPYVRESETGLLARYPAPLYAGSRVMTTQLLAGELAAEARAHILERAPDAEGWLLGTTP